MEILQEMVIPDHHTSILRNMYTGLEATVKNGHGTTDWFQIGKGVREAVYCHPAYLTSMQSTSCKMSGWMKHKLESRLPGKKQKRLPGEISVTSDIQYFCLENPMDRGAW